MQLPGSTLDRVAVGRDVDSTSARVGFTDMTEEMRRSSPGPDWIRAKEKPLGRYNGVRIWVIGGNDSILITMDQLGRVKSPAYIAAEASLTSDLRKTYPELKVRNGITPPHM